MKCKPRHPVVPCAYCAHIHTFSTGDLQHLHEDLFCSEMLSSPTLVVACGIVNSLCNT